MHAVVAQGRNLWSEWCPHSVSWLLRTGLNNLKYKWENSTYGGTSLQFYYQTTTSSILLTNTNICCKVVGSLAFRFPPYWYYMMISCQTCRFFDSVYGRTSFWCYRLSSRSVLPPSCCSCLNWNSWSTSKSSSMKAGSNTSIHWSELMKWRGK